MLDGDLPFHARLANDRFVPDPAYRFRPFPAVQPPNFTIEERKSRFPPHCLPRETGYDRCMQDRQEQFAYCVQLFGGTTAFARRLKIDERAIRRFINGERPISDSLLQDTAKALRDLATDANAAAGTISDNLTTEPIDF